LEWKEKGGHQKIEEQLTTMRGWIDKIKNDFEKVFFTKNRLLKLDCSPIEAILVPKLEQLQDETIDFITKEASNDAKLFIEKLIQIDNVKLLILLKYFNSFNKK
jgi:hypothetical protein